MDKINQFPYPKPSSKRNHDDVQPLSVNEKTPVNQIVMPYDQIKAYDMDTNLTLELKRENETATDVNDIAFFILANSKDEYTNVENYSVENGVVNFTMPKVDTDKYYPQIMDKQGRVYSSNDNQFIDVVYNRESRVNELFPMIKHEVIEKVTPAVKQYVMDNKDEFSIKGDKGEKGEKGERGERGKQGYKGNRGEKGEKGDRGEQGIQGEQGERGFRGNRGEQGERGLKGDKGEKGEKGEKGDMGDITQVNPNLISFDSDLWTQGIRYNADNTTTEVSGALSLTDPMNIKKGSTYVFTDYSSYVGAVSYIRLIELEGSTVTNHHEINRGGTTTFVATGNQLRISIQPLENFSVSKIFLINTHGDFRLAFKLETPNKTPFVKAMHDLKLKLDNL